MRTVGHGHFPRSDLQLRRDRPSKKRGEPVDSRGGAVDGLRLGESSGSRLRGELVPNERQGLLGKLLGYLGTNSGGLHEVPSVSEQIVEPDLQKLGASGTPKGPRIASLKNRRTREGGLQRRCGCPVGSDWVVVEVVFTALGHWAVVDSGCEHQIPSDQVIDHIADVPLIARRRRRPLVGTDVGDQITNSYACTCEILDRSGGHPARLRPYLPGCPRVFFGRAVPLKVAASQGAASKLLLQQH